MSRIGRSTRWCAPRVVLASVLWLCPGHARAQDVSLPTLKAAFLMNFVKFVEWPDGTLPPGRRFTFCVAGDNAVLRALQLGVQQHQGRDGANVIAVAREDPFDSCQLLYLGGWDLRDSRQVIGSLDSAPVFTVSDVRGFAEAGGVAELKLENGKVRFAVNLAASRRARLALSAKLLSLATLVKEVAHAPR